jgi:hypothetical protein
MTHDHIHFDADMPPGRWQELDALLDGEPVNRDALQLELGDQEAREYLVDALLLRRMAHAMGPAHYVAPGTPPTAARRLLRRVAAAAVVALSLGAGYVYGQRAEAAPSSLEVSLVTTAPAPPAPEPTQSIRFEPGVNWTTSSGRQ